MNLFTGVITAIQKLRLRVGLLKQGRTMPTSEEVQHLVNDPRYLLLTTIKPTELDMTRVRHLKVGEMVEIGELDGVRLIGGSSIIGKPLGIFPIPHDRLRSLKILFENDPENIKENKKFKLCELPCSQNLAVLRVS